jgi:hypothetical protein
MEPQRPTQAEQDGLTYSKRLPFYDNEEGMALLQQLARRRGVKAAALLRMLVREEARRAGVLPPDVPGPTLNGETEQGRDRGWVTREKNPGLFAAWADEDETEDSEELGRRAAEWEALKARLNENRVAAGEERLF